METDSRLKKTNKNSQLECHKALDTAKIISGDFWIYQRVNSGWSHQIALILGKAVTLPATLYR